MFVHSLHFFAKETGSFLFFLKAYFALPQRENIDGAIRQKGIRYHHTQQ